MLRITTTRSAWSSTARHSGSSVSKRPCQSVWTGWCTPGTSPLSRLIELLAVNPARLLGVPGGELTAGAAADITVLAPELAVTVEAATFRSLARNTPFEGWSLRGGVAATMVGGRTVYVNEAVAGATSFGQRS